MLKAIQALLRKDSIMSDVVERLAQMVADSEYVCRHGWEACAGRVVTATTREPLRAYDKAVNKGEREIRRKVAEHLSINPGEDVSGCLAVLLMAKDIERIGDHGRNIFNIAAAQQEALTGYRYFLDMDALTGKLFPQFSLLQRAIVESSEQQAHTLLHHYAGLKQNIKELQAKLFNDCALVGAEAVNTTLLCRYLKRINAHLGNAASGVIFPLENIDFVSRGLKAEEKDR